jgi:GNAT superfamily N-acetyltransferase
MHNGKTPEAAAASIEVRIMDKDDLRFNQAEMIDLGIEGFKDYFGQYHIGEYTRPKAGIIYANWVKEYVQGGRGITYGAFADGKLAGFLNCDEGNGVLELVLSAVSQAVRGRGVYESMIRASVSDAARRGAIITTSTQFDNFSVQRAWVNIGFKPYYSFYLNHFNSL